MYIEELKHLGLCVAHRHPSYGEVAKEVVGPQQNQIILPNSNDLGRLKCGRLDAAKELNIYLVRHGETWGNIDPDSYKTQADHSITLTPRGVWQAQLAGHFLARHLLGEKAKDPKGFGNIRVWYSSYYRARRTAYEILVDLGEAFDHAAGEVSYREEPFLIEQKAGLYDGLDAIEFAETNPDAARDYAKHVHYNGRVYAMSPLGDSRLDIVKSVKPFFGTIMRDYDEHDIRHVVVVNHGVTMRAFVMGWMRYVPEWLEAEKNPNNCSIRYIHGTRGRGYVDEGYIYGDGMPIRNVMATQRQLERAEDIFMLKPQRSNGMVPPGVTPWDPFAKRIVI